MRNDNLGAPSTLAAELAHLGAMIGPVIPWLIWRRHRGRDTFGERESAVATNFGTLLIVVFGAATALRLFVPFIGFLGTVGQLAVLASSVVLCLQAYSAVRRGVPATYPIDLKVVKTHG